MFKIFSAGRWLLLAYLLIAVPIRTLVMSIRLLFVSKSPRDPNDPYFDVVCFSHVPWGHIWQRNHHTMTRLAKNRKVVYLQTTSIAYIHWFVKQWPGSLIEYNRLHSSIELEYPLLFPGQSRLAPIVWLNRWILTTTVRWHEWKLNLRNTVLWFYYPAASSVLDSFNPAAVVYDIQDEYSAFNWSPRDIAEREQQVLRHADVVFAGTQALYQSKTIGFTGASYFFPCAVEFSHFYSAAPTFDFEALRANPDVSDESVTTLHRIADQVAKLPPESSTTSADEPDTTLSRNEKVSAKIAQKKKLEKATVSSSYRRAAGGQRGLREPAELRQLRRPRLMYVGLIDKRIDPDLICHIAQAEPNWEIVMVGPVDHQLFDQKAVEGAAVNVTFVGSIQYKWLPHFLSYGDVYLMPWKVNDLTRHINPTKTLEYMAAARPVVSVSLPDLENLFSDSVALATTYDEFLSACRDALDGKLWNKVAQGLARAHSFAWESVVSEMEEHVREAIQNRAQRNK